MNINLNVRHAVRFAMAAAAAAAASSAALAQNAAATAPASKELEEVIVTGSRIAASPNDVSVAPVTTITAGDIQKTGLVRVEDLLNNLPQVIAESNSGQSISSDGTATVSLRGLGSQRTLVLINGRRMQPSGSPYGVSSADINQIPAAMLSRVDVLTGGASATYGADAVAGVVNFIMDSHFTGVKVDFDYGTNHHSNDNAVAINALRAANIPVPGTFDGGQNRDWSIVVGANFADGKGNATAYGTYLNTSPVTGSQLDYAACTLNSAASPPTGNAPWDPVACGGSSTSATGRFRMFGTTPSAPSGTRIVNGTVDKTTGLFRPYSAATDSYNYGALSYAQRGSERYTAGAFLNYDLTDHLNVYSETMFALNTSHAQYGPSGAFAYVDVTTHCSNPLFSASELAAFCTGPVGSVNFAENQALYGLTGDEIRLSLARRNVEGGGRVDNYQSNSIREVMGLKGDFGKAWNYDVYGQYGFVNFGDNEDGFLNADRVARALDAVPDPVTGAAVCASALNGTDPACVPWNIWNKGGVTADQLKYITTQSTFSAESKEFVLSGSMTGDLGKYGIKIPSAADGIVVNFGTEYRQEYFAFRPDYIFANGLASGGNGAFTPISGEFHVNEYFVESKVPIVNNVPGIHKLEFDGGYRYSDYSQGFNTDTYKMELAWAPIQDLTVRLSYNRAVRAPNIKDLFGPAFVGAGGNADPCWGATPTFTQAECALTGLAANRYGKVGANPAAQINNTTGGDPNLKPEKADTYTIGFVLQPSVLPGFVMSLDYYKIKIADTITNLSTDTILNNCAKTGDPVYCSRIHRDPISGTLWENQTSFVDTNTQNIGSVVTKGYDLTARYNLSLGTMGKLNFGLVGSRTEDWSTQPTPLSASFDCTGLYGTVCYAPTPRWKHTFSTDWSTPWAGLTLGARWRFTGAVDVDKSSSNPQLNGAYQPGFGHIGGYSYLDLSAAIAWGPHLNFRFGVNNVGDKGPPIVLNGNLSNCPNTTCNDNTWVGTYDTLGRYMYAHVTAKF